MDFDPLVEIPGLDPATVPDGGMVARLRYQQTKIDGAPMTILVGADVVQIIREQQAWVRRAVARSARTSRCATCSPKLAGNRHGNRPGRPATTTRILRQFSAVLGRRDAGGRSLSSPTATGCGTPGPPPCSTSARRSTSSSATSATGHPR